MAVTLPAVVTTDWLERELGAPDLRVVDGTWFLPTEPRDARAEFEQAHIPGAVFFDLDAVADRTTELPHMLPTAEAFAATVGALGIGSRDRVVCYDAHGLYSAPRVWWTFRAFGHGSVAVLEGGLPRWRAEGRPLADGAARPAPAAYEARLDRASVATAAAVRENLRTRRFQLVDLRPAGRFRGEEPEPRPGLRSGHVPGSRNLPWRDLLNDAGDALLPPPELRARLAAAGVDPARPLVAACGSGTTAALLTLALHVLGAPPARLYDGSWAEWGALPDAPTALGAADEPLAPERS